MNIVFKCDNRECELRPCYCRCDGAYNPGEFGDDSVEVPDACPYIGSDCEPVWRMVGRENPPRFADIDIDGGWFSENYNQLPKSIRDAVDNCEFFGEKARTSYQKVAQFSNLVAAAEQDVDSWSLADEVKGICDKYKKNEILIASLYAGYRIGLVKAARLMREAIDGDSELKARFDKLVEKEQSHEEGHSAGR